MVNVSLSHIFYTPFGVKFTQGGVNSRVNLLQVWDLTNFSVNIY